MPQTATAETMTAEEDATHADLETPSPATSPIASDALSAALLHSLDVVLGYGNYPALAAAAGVSKSHIGDVLAGRNGTTFEVIKGIAREAGVGLDELEIYIDWRKSMTSEEYRAWRESHGMRNFGVRGE